MVARAVKRARFFGFASLAVIQKRIIKTKTAQKSVRFCFVVIPRRLVLPRRSAKYLMK